jgi:hypothetical protein
VLLDRLVFGVFMTLKAAVVGRVPGAFIDVLVTTGSGASTVSARDWFSMPRTHYCLRLFIPRPYRRGTQVTRSKGHA